MPNRLINSTSPYLQQHADNPVDWHEWGPDALALARDSGKPILLSIGYSACHWCHVMAHESFEDEGVAALMNRLYVSIKVDREERPDVDQIYQMAHALLTQRSGGWPLKMFLAPDTVPFRGIRRRRRAPRRLLHTGEDVPRRHLRPAWRRLRALLDRCRVGDSALREDAVRQRPAAASAGRRLARRGKFRAERVVRTLRRTDGRMGHPRDAVGCRRLLLDARRGLGGTRRQVLCVDPVGDQGAADR